MSKELTTDFPVGGGVKFHIGQGGSRTSKDGGLYVPLRQQLSLKEFE